MANILKSRRFWLTLVDIVVSTITFIVSSYLNLDAKTIDLVKFMVVAWQPVIALLIIAYTVDDTVQAHLESKATIAKIETEAYSKE
jgi:hypothetical protein